MLNAYRASKKGQNENVYDYVLLREFHFEGIVVAVATLGSRHGDQEHRRPDQQLRWELENQLESTLYLQPSINLFCGQSNPVDFLVAC